MNQRHKDIAAFVCSLIVLGAFITCLIVFSGCACDRAAYVRQSCGDGGTNISVVIIMPEGGGMNLPVGDSAIKAAVDAYLGGTGIGSAGKAVDGIGKGVATVEAIKAAK